MSDTWSDTTWLSHVVKMGPKTVHTRNKLFFLEHGIIDREEVGTRVRGVSKGKKKKKKKVLIHILPCLPCGGNFPQLRCLLKIEPGKAPTNCTVHYSFTYFSLHLFTFIRMKCRTKMGKRSWRSSLPCHKETRT